MAGATKTTRASAQKEATTTTGAGTSAQRDFPKTRAALEEAGKAAAGVEGRNMAKGREPMKGPDDESEKGKKGDITAVVDIDELAEKAVDAATTGSLSGRKIADVKAAIPKGRNGFKLD